MRRSADIRLEAVRHSSWAAVAERFSGVNVAPATPFQSGNWLRAWYDTLGAQPGVQPIPLELKNAKTGEPVFGVPLVKQTDGPLTVIEFADASVTDYNAPLIGESFADVSPRRLLSALRREFSDADELRFLKMPTRLAGQTNPFSQIVGVTPSELGSNVVSISPGAEGWAEYRKRLPKKVRKELERSFRVFQRDGNQAEFRVVDDADEALQMLEHIERLQAQRMQELGLPFVLNDPQYAAFFRRLIELELAEGRLLLTVLISEPGELVGALMGLRDGEDYAMIRLAQAGHEWARCSPGKLVIDQTMAYLNQRGVSRFDFTTGNYSYKKSFLPDSEALTELVVGLSWQGRLVVQRDHLVESSKEVLRRSPEVYGAFKRLVGR